MKLKIGVALLVFGLLGLAGGVAKMIEGDTKKAVPGFLGVSMMIAGGAFLIRAGRKEQGPEALALRVAQQASGGLLTPSSLILRAARQFKGRITVAEAATATSLPFEQVQKELESLVKASACQKQVGHAGTIVYYFPEFEDAQNKQDILSS